MKQDIFYPFELFATRIRDPSKASCALARIEFFHDENAGRPLLAETYSLAPKFVCALCLC
jgi:hypothetical protein